MLALVGGAAVVLAPFRPWLVLGVWFSFFARRFLEPVARLTGGRRRAAALLTVALLLIVVLPIVLIVVPLVCGVLPGVATRLPSARPQGGAWLRAEQPPGSS